MRHMRVDFREVELAGNQEACGTPCVTTDVGDAAQIVGETGWVVPPRDAAALAEGIAAALKEWRERPDEWAARRCAARERIVETFGLDRMVQAYRRVWGETVAEGRK